MIDKYYTPDIKEFYIGFEYQMKVIQLDMEDEDKLTLIENAFLIGLEDTLVPKPILNWSNTIEFGFKGCYDLTRIKSFIKQGRLRVKLLDKEDIESLGYVLNNSYNNYHTFCKENGVVIKMSSNPNETTKPIGIFVGGKELCFQGKLKNKSELKKLLTQLGI
jgi:hypothetical protein